MSDQLDIKAIHLGALPIVNHYINSIGVQNLFERHVSSDPRDKIPVSKTLGIILRNIILERYPLYRIGEWALLRGVVSAHQRDCMTDDRIGRALDRLFRSDRATLLTQVVLNAIEHHTVCTDRLHNDSTTISLFGEYGAYENLKSVKPRRGINKDHRPDLKQVLFSLSASADEAVPLYFKLWDGNTTDDSTHIRNWNSLRSLVGRSDFTYVADSKLCVRETLMYIEAEGGKFVTVLPETRQEIRRFQDWIQQYTPQWQLAIKEPNPRGKASAPREYWTFDSPFLSSEGFRIVWIKSSLKQIDDEQRRMRRIEATEIELRALAAKKHRNQHKLESLTNDILNYYKTAAYFDWQISPLKEETFKQVRRGRPDDQTAYRKIERISYQLTWCQKADRVLYEARYDGIFPLLTNLKDCASAILNYYKFQPRLEKRFEQMKTVYDVAPVFLKNTGRIEAILFLYFLAILITSLIERSVRIAMKDEGLKSIPIYPEDRECKSPTASKILELFSDIRLQHIVSNQKTVRTIPDTFSDRQKLVLKLLKIEPLNFYNEN
jgi:transposase